MHVVLGVGGKLGRLRDLARDFLNRGGEFLRRGGDGLNVVGRLFGGGGDRGGALARVVGGLREAAGGDFEFAVRGAERAERRFGLLAEAGDQGFDGLDAAVARGPFGFLFDVEAVGLLLVGAEHFHRLGLV